MDTPHEGQRSDGLDRPEAVVAPPAPAAPAGATFDAYGRPELDGRRLADWGYRAGGWLIDVGAVVACAYGVALVAFELGASTDTGMAIAGLLLLVLFVLNQVVLSGVTGGRTLGKLVGGMRIVREDGRPAGFGTGLLRNVLARVIYVVPFGFLVDSLWAVGDARQTLRDKMVGTRVVQEPSYRRRAWAVGLGALVAVAAAGGAIAALPDTAGDDDYSAFDRQVFVDGCSEGSGGLTKSECGCVFDYIRERVPYADYARADRIDDPDDWPANVRNAMSKGLAKC